jgi:chemotaxis protein CheY-P-specific phosphatase CheC
MSNNKHRKVDSVQVERLITGSMKTLENISSKLFNTSIKIEPMGGMIFDIESVVNCFKTNYYPVKAVMDKGFDGKVFMFIDEKAVMILSSMLLGHGPDLIQERLKNPKLEGLMEDSFSEIANQLFGGVDRYWSKIYNKGLHLKKEFTPVVPHDSDEARKFFEEGDKIKQWVSWVSKISIPGYEECKLIFLFPKNFSEWLFGQEASKIKGQKFAQVVSLSPGFEGGPLLDDAFCIDGFVVEEVRSMKGFSRLILNHDDRPFAAVVLRMKTWKGLARSWSEKLARNPALDGVPIIILHENEVSNMDRIEIESWGFHLEQLPDQEFLRDRIADILNSVYVHKFDAA